MRQSYNERRDDTELIELLVAISIVSARLARNMSIHAAIKQLEEGRDYYECNH